MLQLPSRLIGAQMGYEKYKSVFLLRCVALIFLLLIPEQASLETSRVPSIVAQAPPEPTEADPKARRVRIDNVFGRTTTRAFFEVPDNLTCFALGGLFAFDDRGGVSFTYPHAIAQGVGLAWKRENDERVLTFQDQNCRIRLFVSKEVFDGEHWIQLGLD